MINKKMVSITVVTTMMAGVLAACGSSSSGTSTTAAEAKTTAAETTLAETTAAETTSTGSGAEDAIAKVTDGKSYNISFSSHNATGTNGNLAIEHFVDLVKDKSGGRINITFYQDGTLANELDAMQMVKTGELQMALSCDNFCTQLVDGYDPTIIPFVFQNSDDAIAVYDDDNLGTLIKQKAEENGNVYLLGVQKRTPRLLTAKSEIKTPDELKGINIRVPQIDYWSQVWNGLGAVSTVVDWNETYQALQTGVVDAQENPIDNIYTNKIYEVNPYVMNTEHQYGANHWLINKDFYDGMDQADKDLMQQCIDASITWGNEQLEEGAKQKFDELEGNGNITVVDVDKKVWSDAAQSTVDSILSNSFDSEVQKYVEDYRSKQ